MTRWPQLAFLVGWTSSLSAQTVIRVPGDAGTIQEAITRARTGDTVLVAPGRYYENIRFLGKGIVLTSHFSRSGDAADVSGTIIDGSRPQHPDTGSVVLFVDNEDSSAVLQGFTITGGTGTIWRDAGNGLLYREGGGILCDFSAPVIRSNRIIGNKAVQRGPGIMAVGGGGIRCGFAEPTIEFNVIRDNEARYGAGVVLFRSTSVFRHNLVVENIGAQGLGGAGVWMSGYLTRYRPSLVEHNTIVRNRALLADSGRRGPLSGTAGGLALGTIAVVRNNLIWGNSQGGGGPQLALPPGITPEQLRQIRLERNLIQGGLAEGATAFFGSDATLNLEPEFIDLIHYALKPGSPGRRAGAPPTSGSERPDIGAYGGRGANRLPR